MLYYLKESKECAGELFAASQRMTASVKPREDVDAIFGAHFENAVEYPTPKLRKGKRNLLTKLLEQRESVRDLKKALSPLKRGDTLFLQYPLLFFSLWQNRVFKGLKRRGVTLVALVHDLDWLRDRSRTFRWRLRMRVTKKSFRYFSRAIVHNEKMQAALAEFPLRTVSLGIFDYLTEGTPQSGKRGKDLPIVIAGNLAREKAAYVYCLPEETEWNLYGPHFEGGGGNINYHGAFPPQELLSALEGSFGLVWDGTSERTCSGSWGEYLRYNDPHKTSLYLAAGLPVIIWQEAALAPFLRKEGCGIAVSDLRELPSVLSAMTEEEYETLCENARRIGALVRKGYFTDRAIEKCLDQGE